MTPPPLPGHLTPCYGAPLFQTGEAMSKRILVASLTVVLASCGENLATSNEGDLAHGLVDSSLTLTPAAAQQVLDLVNYPGTDLTVLTSEVELDATVASKLVAARNGVDGVTPSTDDALFTTIAAVRTTAGTAGLSRLATWAAAHPAPTAVTVKGLTLLGWEAESMVWGVNQATLAELDALVDSRAATSLFNHRPFTSVAQLATFAWVGATALNGLRGGALGWWTKAHGTSHSLAGRFDGAVFTETEAATALQIVNGATTAQLVAHHLTSTAAGKIVAARPFTSLAQVAALSGIGSATMNALLAYAQSGQWGASCVSAFSAAVTPHLSALLFLSESDRPFDVVSFAGAGTSVPTAASVMALVAAPAGSTAELRDLTATFANFEPASASADPGASAAVQAVFTAQLTDVVVVAVHPPPTSVDHSLVDVYVVGRTSCGDLVGLHTISVET